MKFTLAARLVNEGNNTVTLDIPSLRALALTGIQEIRAIDTESGDQRTLSRDEERDLQGALDDFAIKQMAKALSEYITLY
jgi:hypothetical protein